MAATNPTNLVAQFFATDVNSYVQGISDLETATADKTPQSDRHFGRLCMLLDSIREACRQVEESLSADRDLLKSVQAKYQAEIAPWMDKSWMMRHAKQKPRGYPGDFEILQAIYDGVPKSGGLGGYLDMFFLNTELGRAVPSRLRSLKRFLRQELGRRGGRVAVLDVACGPCADFSDGFEVPEGCTPRIACLDYDSDALQFAARKVAAPYRRLIDFEFIRYNALRMKSSKSFVGRHGRFDIIYSVGLCDYLPDRHLIALLRGWKETLHDDGVVYVAFKDARRYDHVDYQWVLDWYFYQRGEEDCRRILRQAGWQESDLQMERDETGIIMNFAARSAHQRAQRLDEAHPTFSHGGAPSAIPGQVQHEGGDPTNLASH